MKIRKANIVSEDKMITDVYLHENKKQSHTLVAVPELEWSALISYEEEKRPLVQKLKQSLAKTCKQMLRRSFLKRSSNG